MLLIFCLTCICLLAGCDRIFKRQVNIDFRQNHAGSFTVAEPGDLDKFISKIEGIAQRNGFKCRPYRLARKSHSCYNGTVTLTSYTSGLNVRLELTQFGPWAKTGEFSALEKDISDFIKEEFSGQDVRITDPLE